MLVLLDTSTPECRLRLVEYDGVAIDSHWEAGRTLEHGLLRYLHDELDKQQKQLTDISGIGVYKGPGSFTGLRIGIAVMNTLADTLKVPIVGVSGTEWQNDALHRLEAGENDVLVLPEYGAEAHITTPRK